jgi:2-haloacid dehalogenase
MPPYPEVPEALRRLKAAGFHLFTLTDNTAAISGRQLTNGGLIDLFDRRFSVDDTAKRHKPAPEAYAEVTRALGVRPSEMCLVACHTWDTIGAQAAGWEAGLIKRVNNDVLDTAAQPGYLGKDLNAIADQIIARHGPARG